MKLTITYLFLMIVFSIHGQVTDSITYFYTIDKDTFQGKYSFETTESGFIDQFRKIVFKYKTFMRPLPLTKETEFTYETKIAPLYSGELKNGKKVGKWTSYADEGIGYSWEQTIFEVFSTTYKTDTTVYRTFNSSITYVKDSMLVYGYVYTKDEHQYWINFECKNKKDCIYWYESKGNIIETSNYDELDLILGRFEYGEYNRKIRLLEKK